MDNPRGNSSPKMKWSLDDDKLYEDALKEFPEEVENRWEKIASRVPGKSPEDIKAHYNALFGDSLISVFDFPDNEANPVPINHTINYEEEPRWTEDEHRLFLKGLNEYGKDHLTEIVKYVVRSRTPTQVGAHAHRYYKRLNINCGIITLQPIRVPLRAVFNMTAGGVMVSSPTNISRSKNPTDALNSGAMKSSPADLPSQGRSNPTTVNGAMKLPSRNLPNQEGNYPTEFVNSSGIEPPPTNLPSQGGSKSTDAVNGVMEPPSTKLPCQEGKNPTDAFNSGAMVPPPTNLPSQEGNNTTEAVNSGVLEQQLTNLPKTTNLPSQEGNDTTDAVNTVVMEQQPTNLPSQGGNNPTDAVICGALKPLPTNLPSQGRNNPTDVINSSATTDVVNSSATTDVVNSSATTDVVNSSAMEPSPTNLPS